MEFGKWGQKLNISNVSFEVICQLRKKRERVEVIRQLRKGEAENLQGISASICRTEQKIVHL